MLYPPILNLSGMPLEDRHAANVITVSMVDSAHFVQCSLMLGGNRPLATLAIPIGVSL